MLKRYFCRSRVLERIEESPHSHAIKQFVTFLGSRGHTRHVVQSYTQAIEHFYFWLAQHDGASLDCDTVRDYLSRHLLDCSCPSPSPCLLITNRTALKLLLRSANLPWTKCPSRDSKKERLLDEYDKHLFETAGLAAETRRCRSRHAREFLDKRFPSASPRETSLTSLPIVLVI